MSDEFEFNYSAPTNEERREIENIRQSYLPDTKAEGKLERLRKLDRRVKNIPTATSVSIGVMGLLIFGLGLSMVLEWSILLWGIIVGVIGVAVAVVAYPIYWAISKHLKNKHSKEILDLSKELLKDEK